MIDFLKDNFGYVLIIVFFGIYEQTVDYLKRRLVEEYKDKIANAKDSQEAMKLRQDYKYKKGNIILFARFAVIVFIIVFSWLKEHEFNMYTILYIGFYCVDNLPVVLLPKFLELLGVHNEITRIAIGFDLANRILV